MPSSFPTACAFRYNGLSFVYLIYLLLIPLFSEPTKATMQGKSPWLSAPGWGTSGGDYRKGEMLVHRGAGALDGDEFLLLKVVFPTHVPRQACVCRFAEGLECSGTQRVVMKMKRICRFSVLGIGGGKCS